MASYRGAVDDEGRPLSKHPQGRPWLARVQKAGKRHDLGYYETEDEAIEVEEQFRRDNGMGDTTHLGRHNVKLQYRTSV